ncbi:MAG TPA: DUF493 domain-containing protein [Bacteroidales bacterium]|mgnify:CR=1 FL=1|jgi:putative lipoic acid-binding regulatory protein|nr:hypothetical protein [Bacteroidota bacterium]HJN05891.1 DUF493 domain-containing protein [Bacteroidales bacterium]|tara:strand:- start:137 stop:454 length:318 start_codon:yes stop_codon:yes gene_type:complete
MTKKKVSDNGNLKNLNKAIKGVKIEFPVTFELKAVFDATATDDENKNELIELFDKLDISYSYKGNKKSSKGAYVSYNYKVTLQSKSKLEKLYSDLKNIPGLKFAL